MKLPEECTNINEVRDSIDQIDEEIVDLLKRRFAFVKEVVKYKEANKDSIIAKERFDKVISKRREMAKEAGLDPDVIEKVYRTLIEYFINEELKIMNINK
jgi:isochorismate pyruvate lyase